MLFALIKIWNEYTDTLLESDACIFQKEKKVSSSIIMMKIKSFLTSEILAEYHELW